MTLDINQIPSIFSSTYEGDGTFARKNVQINREDTQPVLQNEGDMILWEKGEGFIYDNYDTIIDLDKWTLVETSGGSVDTAEVQESSNYIQAYTKKIIAGDWTFDVSAATKDLPLLVDMTEVEVRCKFSNESAGIVRCNFYAFGNLILSDNDSFPTYWNDDSVWTLIKRIDEDWDVYKDEIYWNTITPSDNTIKVQNVKLAGVWNDSVQENFARLYDIKVGGGTFLLIKSSQRTFKIDLTSF